MSSIKLYLSKWENQIVFYAFTLIVCCGILIFSLVYGYEEYPSYQIPLAFIIFISGPIGFFSFFKLCDLDAKKEIVS
jgi:hypothetical protein